MKTALLNKTSKKGYTDLDYVCYDFGSPEERLQELDVQIFFWGTCMESREITQFTWGFLVSIVYKNKALDAVQIDAPNCLGSWL